jgi:hypothetical protein
MSNLINFGRQNVKVAVQKFDFADAPTGVASALKIAVPSGSIVLGGGVQVTTAFNSTTNVVDVGDSGSANRFANDLDLKTTGFKPFTTLGTLGSGLKAVEFTHVSTGTAASQGAGYVVIQYVEPTRADEVME